MKTVNEYFPQTVLHPGSTLEEKLQEMGMSIKEFALRTEKPEKTIIAVLKGTSAITQEMAKLNWVESTRDAEEKTVRLLSYFGVASHSAWEKLYIESVLKVAAYISLKHTHQPHAISAWLRQGELQARQIEAPVFDVKKLKSNIPAMRQLMIMQPADFFVQLQKLCLQAGVILLFTPKLPKVPLSSSTRWLNNTPLIQLTTPYKKNDSFWLTFFHELGHIILHGKKYISLENVDFAAADPKKEEEAHQFATAQTGLGKSLELSMKEI